ncbi:MAG: hypothetical protein OEW00_13070 [candidate division Zixibacteria bacterium]|nr:hypothetical protein [candidate division Zixibacteria bacterium]
MRIHDTDNDRTISNVALYLTSMEAAQMIGFLLDMIKKCRIRDFGIVDAECAHELRVYLYNEFEQTGFDERQKKLIAEDA